jgi:hypothetical protein
MRVVEGRPRASRHATGTAVTFACDFCGAGREKAKRIQLVWLVERGNEVVLADLCERCATRQDRILRRYGGRGRDAMTIREPPPPPPAWIRLADRTELALLRGVLYVMIAVVFFFIVTYVTAHS